MTNGFSPDISAVKVKRQYAGCYLLTLCGDEVYVERADSDMKKWVASNCEFMFDRYADAKAMAATVMVESAA